MPVYSMTGYASAQHGASAEDGGASGRNSRLGLEIRSVNSRFLDLSFRLPDELRAHEPALRALLTARLKRGKRSEEHTSELQSRQYLVCRLLLEKKKKIRHFGDRPMYPSPAVLST